MSIKSEPEKRPTQYGIESVIALPEKLINRAAGVWKRCPVAICRTTIGNTKDTLFRAYKSKMTAAAAKGDCGKPYSKITVQNIVERCQVNRNTFYYYFQDIPTLVECSIQAWTESVIRQNCQLGSLADCVIPATRELVNRKKAFIHLYHSANRESLMRYLSEISQHMAQCYIDNATRSVAVPKEDRETLAWGYKCVLVGVIMDWLDNDASYDLPVFCERIFNLFAGSEKRAFLMHTEEAR